MHALHLFRPEAQRTREGGHSRSRQRPLRRITGYHNALDEPEPPTYEANDRGHGADHTSSRSQRPPYDPPPYSCTAFCEGILEMRFERTSPFDSVRDAQWDKIHVRIQGTMLELRYAKTHGLFTPASVRGTVTGEAGKLLKKFTLQHAEVGLAADYRKVEMVPKSPIAQLLPVSALKQLQETDPYQFDIVYNYVIRIRVEGNQILFRYKAAEERADWVVQLCAAIDIAPPLDVRSEPRYHTLPRRRRREQHTPPPEPREEITPDVIQEQERIMRHHYPHLMFSHNDRNREPVLQEEPEAVEEEAAEETAEDPDRYDLDAFMTIDQSETQAQDEESFPRQPTDAGDQILASDPAPASDSVPTRSNGGRAKAMRKWRPACYADPAREARYKRRCMPVLVYNSRYSSDIIISNGKRMTIDWESRTLQPYPLPPPSYITDTPTESSNGSTAMQTLRHLLRQTSSSALRTSFERNDKQPATATITPSGEMTDCSGDDGSFSPPTTSWKGATAFRRHIRHMTKSKITPSTRRSCDISMSVNKVESGDSGDSRTWRVKSIPNTGSVSLPLRIDDNLFQNS